MTLDHPQLQRPWVKSALTALAGLTVIIVLISLVETAVSMLRWVLPLTALVIAFLAIAGRGQHPTTP